MTNAILFHASDSEIIRIDKHGFHYCGQFIEDAGEAHRLLVDFLRTAMPNTDWKHATELEDHAIT